MTNEADVRRGRALAGLLEPHHAEILGAYQAALERDESVLLEREDAREQVLAHADQTLRDVYQALRTGATVWPSTALPKEIGRTRGARRVHPTESRRAAALLYDASARTFARVLRDHDDAPEALIHVLGLLGSRIVFGTMSASATYLGALLEQLNTAHVAERRRISRELHDQVASGVNAAYRSLELGEMYLEGEPERAAAKLHAAKSALVQTLDTIREVMAGLRTGVGKESLKTALEKYVEAANPPKPAATVEVVGNEAWMLPEAREELYLTLREAVRNVLRHAQARSLDVRVNITPYEADCLVSDDGIGFDPGKGSSAPRHIGLLSMRERVELLRGEFAVETGPDLGTRLHIVVPLMGIQNADNKG